MIDVIVPIYGNLDLLRGCVDSVIACSGDACRLILLDDASPGPAIGQYLADLASHPRCVVFRNRGNLGFVSTVNRGLRMSQNDVVILNSDVLVTPGWLTKLHACAYSNPRVATVTPLTNEGTICAVPEWNRKNSLPAGYTLNEFAALIERLSPRSYPEIPTGVGFCMYIRRSALDAVGCFDDVTFRRGYGEENDFCVRASALGYKNLLDDSTFVYHEGGESFAAEKAALFENNYRALLEKHTDYDDRVTSFISENPLRAIQISIQKALDGSVRPRLRVFVLLHHPLHVIGGTEAHTNDLIAGVEAADVLVAYPDGEALRVDEFRDGNRVLVERFAPAGADTNRSRAWYASLLQRLRIQVLHVQHLLKNDREIVLAAHDLGIPVLVVWHDYYLLCPQYTLINANGSFCGWCRDLAECDRCLAEQVGYPAGFQKAWRAISQEIANLVDAHVFPSRSSLQGARNILTIDPAKCHVIPHGTARAFTETSVTNGAGSALRVAYLGVRSHPKGFELFCDLMTALGNQDIEWHTFGDSPQPIAPSAGVTHHGAYARHEIGDLLRKAHIDLALLLSVWPETFCYTLSEAWAAGIPVVGSSLGAIGERISESGAGWVVNVTKPEEVVRLLRGLAADRTDLREKAERARSVQLTPVAEMGGAYRGLYRKLIDRSVISI